jgi:hypothetical protein
MAIGLILQLASELIEVRIDNNIVYFRTANTGGAFATIDNLKLSYSGVVKEHPDLKDVKDWREQTIKRFKDKIKTIDTEEKQATYIIEDLKKYGYKPLYKQKKGFRPIKL